MYSPTSREKKEETQSRVHLNGARRMNSFGKLTSFILREHSNPELNSNHKHNHYWEPEHLPVEIWIQIFSHLGGNDLVNLALVCKYFHQISLDAKLWYSIFTSKFGDSLAKKYFKAVKKYDVDWKHCAMLEYINKNSKVKEGHLYKLSTDLHTKCWNRRKIVLQEKYLKFKKDGPHVGLYVSATRKKTRYDETYASIKLSRIADIIIEYDAFVHNGMDFSSMEIVVQTRFLVYHNFIFAAAGKDRNQLIDEWATAIWERSRLAKILKKVSDQLFPTPIKNNNNNNSDSDSEQRN